MSTFANSEDPDKILQNVPNHQGLYCLLEGKQFSGNELNLNLEILIYDRLIYMCIEPSQV